MDELVWVGLGGAPVVVALTLIVKPFVLDRRFWPIIALVWGLAINVGWAWARGTDLATAVALGVMSGLAASGLWSGIKNGAEPPSG